MNYLHDLKSTYIIKPLLLLFFLYAGLVANAHAENCQLQLSESTLDYGNLTRAAIMDKQSNTQQLKLGSRQMTLNVLCQRPTAIAVMVRGTDGQHGFTFGESGQFTLRLSDALLDGTPVNLGQSQVAGKRAGEANASITILPDSKVFPRGEGRSIKGRIFSLQVHVDPEVTDAATRVRDSRVWQGSVTFSVVER